MLLTLINLYTVESLQEKAFLASVCMCLCSVLSERQLLPPRQQLCLSVDEFSLHASNFTQYTYTCL